MKPILVGIVVAVTIFVSWMIYALVSEFVIGPCDAKFGCWGGVQFAMFIAGVSCVIAFIVFFITHTILLNRYKTTSSIVPGVISGLILSVVLSTFSSWGFDIAGMVVAWGAICFATCFVMVYLERLTRTVAPIQLASR